MRRGLSWETVTWSRAIWISFSSSYSQAHDESQHVINFTWSHWQISHCLSISNNSPTFPGQFWIFPKLWQLSHLASFRSLRRNDALQNIYALRWEKTGEGRSRGNWKEEKERTMQRAEEWVNADPGGGIKKARMCPFNTQTLSDGVWLVLMVLPGVDFQWLEWKIVEEFLLFDQLMTEPPFYLNYTFVKFLPSSAVLSAVPVRFFHDTWDCGFHGNAEIESFGKRKLSWEEIERCDLDVQWKMIIAVKHLRPRRSSSV